MSLFDIFAADSAYILNDIGRTVNFRGVDAQAIVADPNPAEALMMGGFTQQGSGQVFKFLRGDFSASPPVSGEIITFDGVKWFVETVESRPLSPWYKCNCKRWDS
jgi:hypothetical protein